MISNTYNMDCMEALRGFPDKFFDLAVVDPPYGSGGGRSTEYGERFGGWFDRYKSEPDGRKVGEKVRKKIVAWDIAPSEEYFKELFRVSRAVIIWGGNNFRLPGSRNFIVWDKKNISENFTMAMCEYAWTNIPGNAKIFRMAPQGQKGRFHPTQKPVELYDWVFRHYAKPGDKVLDTHLGSGSSRIAAYEAGLDFWGYEIDPDYYAAQEKRFEEHTNQLSLFHMEE